MSRSGCSARKTRGTRCSRRCGSTLRTMPCAPRSEEHTSELQSQSNLVCRLLLEKKTKQMHVTRHIRNKTSYRFAPYVHLHHPDKSHCFTESMIHITSIMDPRDDLVSHDHDQLIS